jgi:stringent starvation protein B
MNSTRPYLIRAFYDWIVDNNCTPHIVVNAHFADVEVPREYVESGQIVLNIAITAVQGLRLGDQAVEFQARFGGQVRRIHAPVASVLAIYAKENGRGMVFAEEEDSPTTPPPPVEANSQSEKNSNIKKGGKKPGDRSHLTVIK